MSKFQGTAIYVGFIVAGGTVNLTPSFTKVDFTTASEDTDVTAGNLAWATSQPGQASWKANCDLYFDDSASANTGGTADLNKMPVRTTGVFFFGPGGTVTGQPKYGGSVHINKHDFSVDFGANAAVKVSLGMTGLGTPYWNHGSAF